MFSTAGPSLTALAPIISAFVAVLGVFLAWRKSRESALRRGDVLAWANEVIRELETLLLICVLKGAQLEPITAKTKLTEVLFNTAILIERGRLFFRNQVVGDHGREKESAYRGYRPKILDPIVVAHQIALEWDGADGEKQLRMRLIAEDCLKKFVSLVQKEVGRGRTASADTGEGGDGGHLRHLLDTVNVKRLDRLMSAERTATGISVAPLPARPDLQPPQ
jgi:hypothetical protein